MRKEDEKIPEEKLKELQEKHGEIAVVPTKRGPCAFRSATRPEYQRYKSQLINEKTRAQSFDILVRQLVVYPSQQDFESYLEKSPGISDTCLPHVLALCGADTEAEAKKYESGSEVT